MSFIEKSLRIHCKPIPVMKTGFSLCTFSHREKYTGKTLFWPCTPHCWGHQVQKVDTKAKFYVILFVKIKSGHLKSTQNWIQFLFNKKFRNCFYLLPAFCLTIQLMRSPKNFENNYYYRALGISLRGLLSCFMVCLIKRTQQ